MNRASDREDRRARHPPPLRLQLRQDGEPGSHARPHGRRRFLPHRHLALRARLPLVGHRHRHRQVDRGISQALAREGGRRNRHRPCRLSEEEVLQEDRQCRCYSYLRVARANKLSVKNRKIFKCICFLNIKPDVQFSHNFRSLPSPFLLRQTK